MMRVTIVSVFLVLGCGPAPDSAPDAAAGAEPSLSPEAVALQLAMDGDLDLDAPVSTWFGDEDWFPRVPNHAEWTGGGLVNNPQAMVRWAKLLYEGEAIEGEDLPQLLEVGFPADSAKPHLGYGLAVSVAESEHGLTYGHGGFWPGYNSLLAYYPDHGVAVSIQINSDESRMRDHLPKLASVVLAALADASR